MSLRIKNYIRIAACIVAFWVSLGIIKGIFNMPDDIFISYLFGAFVIIGCVLFNRRYHKHYAGKVKEVIKILEGKEPEKRR